MRNAVQASSRINCITMMHEEVKDDSYEPFNNSSRALLAVNAVRKVFEGPNFANPEKDRTVFEMHETGIQYQRRASKDPSAPLISADETRCQRCLRGVQRLIKYVLELPSNWIFLVLLGLLCGCVGALFQVTTDGLQSLRLQLTDWVQSYWLGYLIWLLWSVLFGSIAVFAATRINRFSAGSGIPEIKTILNGTMLPGRLDMSCLFAKFIGLAAALACNMSAGKEGPFVQISCILAYQLSRLPYFKHIHTSERMLNNMLAASIGAGVAAVFGTPVGGVLYAIEITVTYYLVGNLWRSFVCSVVCVIFYKLSTFKRGDDAFLNTAFSEFLFSWEVLAFIVLGAICGLFSSLFVHSVSKFIILQQNLKKMFSPYVPVIAVAVFTAIVTYPIPYMRLSEAGVVNAMFHKDPLETYEGEHWSKPNLYLNLVFFLLMKFTLTSLTITLPISAGLYTPVFLMGSILGRIYGEILQAIFPSRTVTPGAYAVVGAAAVTSGVTHSVATAVIVFELTGQVQHLIPILLGILVSRSVATAYSVSIYELMLHVRKLPFLPHLKLPDLHGKTAADLMDTRPCYLTLTSTYKDADQLLAKTAGNSAYDEIALVKETHDGQILIGSLNRAQLDATVEMLRYSMGFSLDGDVKMRATPAKTVALDSRINQMFKKSAPTSPDGKYRSMSYSAAFTSRGESPAPSGTVTPDTGSPPTMEETRLKADRFLSPLDLSPPYGTNEKSQLIVDQAPISVVPETPLTKLHFLFTITTWPTIFITNRGNLVGVVGKRHMVEKFTNMDHSSTVSS